MGRVHEFVRNEIPFGYNRDDDTPASEVLREGLGQCNTKSTLLLSLLRAVGVPCRIRGLEITKDLQRGALGPLVYALAPARILHSWVEVRRGDIFPDGHAAEKPDAWMPLEGVIIDEPYLEALRRRFPAAVRFTGYGVATTDLRAPGNAWEGGPTFIQREGVVVDHGAFDDPDGMFAALGTNLGWARERLWDLALRGPLNRRIQRLRGRGDAGSAGQPDLQCSA